MTDRFQYFIIAEQYKRTVTNLILQTMLLLLATFPLLAFAGSHWQKDNYISDSFIEIALRHEYADNATVKFSRWQKPMKIFIKNKLDDQGLTDDMYRVHAQHLQKITGHPIGFVDAEAQANTLVVFTSTKDFKNDVLHYLQVDNFDSVFRNVICLATFQTNAAHEITRGYIFIPVDKVTQKGKLTDCIVEELTQMMGLTNDSNAVYPSIFNDRSADTYLSCLDYVLLKIAYHPDLKPGMSESQIRHKLPLILAQLRKTGEIAQAQSRVLEDSVEKWSMHYP